MNTLLIRADATTEIGTGHVMRCLALAQGWQEHGGKAVFLSHCESDSLHLRIENEGIDFKFVDRPHPDPVDLQATLSLLSELQAEWLVTDGYHFDQTYHQAVRKAGYRLLVIDDFAHLPEYYADILLNQNINAGQPLYMSSTDSKLLLGTHYVLLRPEFLAWRGRQRETSQGARKVLVTMGGSDPDNVTLKVMKAIQHMEADGIEVIVVAGGSNPHAEILNSLIQNSRVKFHLERDAANMPYLMAWADVAVSAGGTTCGELAFMGVPGILLVLAGNQYANAEELGKSGVALNLGWHGQVSPEQIAQSINWLLVSAEMRREMARKGQELVDGDGIGRILMRMNGEKIRLRHVCAKDIQLIWQWANSPDVREVSFSPELIPWERHLQWFTSKLHDPDCIFYIAVNEEDIPVGQIRYEVKGHEATVSISLSDSVRGKGYGSALLTMASRQFYRISQAKVIHAYIKMVNGISLQAFVKAGFKQAGTMLVNDQAATHLVLPKEAIG